MNEVFRPRRFYLVASLGVFALFTSLIVMAIAETSQIMQDRGRTVAMCLFMPFVLFMEGASIYGFIAYFRERLELREDEVVFRAMWRQKRIRRADATMIQRRSRPVGGSVVLRSDSEKIVITFGNFTQPERSRIVEYLKTRFCFTNSATG